MKALDTNILARYYAKDDATQSAIALRIMLSGDGLFVPRTVVLEFEWVMRYSYQLAPSRVGDLIEHLLGLANVTVEDAATVERALPLYRRGFDFADALHWAASRDCAEFLTFDNRRFASRAGRMKLTPPCRVPR